MQAEIILLKPFEVFLNIYPKHDNPTQNGQIVIKQTSSPFMNQIK